MAVVIVQKPDSISMSGNLKPLILQNSREVEVTLTTGSETVLSETYYPGNGNLIEIDLRDVVDTYLSFTFPTSDVFQQTALARSFQIAFGADTQTVSFTAVRAGKLHLNQSASGFLTENFLTWQPQVKSVTYYSPEWLTYYAIQTCVVKLKAYFEGGTSQELTLASPAAGQCYTFNLQYAVISGKLQNKRPTYYDVWVETSSGTRLSYVQRYIAGAQRSNDENWYLFENSLGGLDSVRAYGSLDDDPEYSNNLAIFDGESVEYRVDVNRRYTRNTGYLTPHESRWLQDMFSSRQKYAYKYSGYYKIVFLENNASGSSVELPNSYTFTYRFAENLPFLDIPRNDSLPTDIELKTPDGDTFFLPPRLAEFPKLTLNPDILLLAQEPHTEQWGTLTSGTFKDRIVNELVLQLQGLDMNPKTEGGGSLDVVIIKTTDLTLPTDENVFSAARTLMEINKALTGTSSVLDNRYLRKDVDDLASGNIRFAKQISSETFATGLTGTGWRITQEGDGEMRSLFLREWLETPELRYNRVTVTGDEFWVATGVKADKVEGNTITAKLEEGEVIAVHEGDILRGIYHHENGFSTSFIKVVSVDTSAGTFTYEKIRGADPVRFMTFARQGNDTDPERQRSIYLSGLEGYQRFLGGVNSADITFDNIYAQFGNLDGLVTPYFGTLSGEGIYIRKGYIEGSIHVTGGNAATKEFVQTEVGQGIANISVGVGNLLLNTGFTGDYSTIDLTSGSMLATDTSLFSDPLKFWAVIGAATAGEESKSQSGFACTFSGTLSQQPIVPVESGQYYTISLWARGSGSLNVKVGGVEQDFMLTSVYQKFVAKLKTVDTTGFSMTASASATVYEVKLERGTVATDWSPSSSDNDKSEAQAISYKYVLDAIQNETDIYGGLVLTNILMVGNYTNGQMSTVTGGLSGVYHDGNDVAFWAGGTLEQAIRAVGDPSRTSNVANAVITHGGLAILNNAYVRGKIYATDGEFTGTIYATSGVLENVTIRTNTTGARIVLDSEDRSIKLYNSSANVVGEWQFYNDTSQILLGTDGSGITDSGANFIGSGSAGYYTWYRMQLSRGNNPQTDVMFRVDVSSASALRVQLGKLPTSKEAALAWGLYRDGDTIKINVIAN